MAKKASTPQKTRTASSSYPASPRPPAVASNERMVLRVKSSKKVKRLAELSSSDNEQQGEERPKSSAKRSKPSSSSKKKNEKFDPNKPKKPPTAFFYFLEDFRKGYQEQNPKVKSMRDIGKACGEKWKSMTYEIHLLYPHQSLILRRKCNITTWPMRNGESSTNQWQSISRERKAQMTMKVVVMMMKPSPNDWRCI